MIPPNHFIFECQNPGCRFRFPVSGRKVTACPVCRQTDLEVIDIKHVPVEADAAIPPSLFQGALLDNIRSIFNVGSIFRTADGLALHHLYLCGITATPEHPRLAKTALGAQFSTPWSYHLNAVDTVRSLIAEGYKIWSLEGGPGSVSLFSQNPLPTCDRIILVIGNEITGVDPHILKISDRILFIPMQGLKGSLNVSVAFGIAAYTLRFSLPCA